VDQPLAYYKRDSGGNIQREYRWTKRWRNSLEPIAGDPGLERALFGVHEWRASEALEVVKGRRSSSKAIRTYASQSIVLYNKQRWTS
jgi:hypothetical protein